MYAVHSPCMCSKGASKRVWAVLCCACLAVCTRQKNSNKEKAGSAVQHTLYARGKGTSGRLHAVRAVCRCVRVANKNNQRQRSAVLHAVRGFVHVANESQLHSNWVQAVLCCAVLCCAVLCCAVLCCTVLCCAVICDVLCCAEICVVM